MLRILPPDPDLADSERATGVGGQLDSSTSAATWRPLPFQRGRLFHLDQLRGKWSGGIVLRDRPSVRALLLKRLAGKSLLGPGRARSVLEPIATTTRSKPSRLGSTAGPTADGTAPSSGTQAGRELPPCSLANVSGRRLFGVV